ncbi:glycosyltransferase [Tenacibaculum ovolyticum]|uniref:glycosyltransferase n=1 Tax=Tenacibaculum ovolyticum TaxID=104270 RepID=UPI003BADB823
MKVILLANCNSIHTIKWSVSLAERDISVIVFSFGKLEVGNYENRNLKIIAFGDRVSRGNLINKLSHLKALPYLKKIIKKEVPDLLHAHYASSYGLLGALTGFRPFILSVWGSDVFSFPKNSFLHKTILKYNLSRADKILSTSKIMAVETNLYTTKKIEVTPFGIDTQILKPMKVESIFLEKEIVIGTIKSLEKVYGIEYLIRAFKIILDTYKGKKTLKLLIVGDGSLELKLKELTKELKITRNVIFKGRIPFDQVPIYHNMIDIFVAASLEESFGVSVIEASSTGKAVVVTNVGGLPEVVEDGETGFLVPKKNSLKLAEAINKLVLNTNLREKMGRNGIKRVKELYEWEKCVNKMILIYKKYI